MYLQLTPTYKGEENKKIFGPFSRVSIFPEGVDAVYEELRKLSVRLFYNKATRLVHYDGRVCNLEVLAEKELERRDKDWKNRLEDYNHTLRADK